MHLKPVSEFWSVSSQRAGGRWLCGGNTLGQQALGLYGAWLFFCIKVRTRETILMNPLHVAVEALDEG